MTAHLFGFQSWEELGPLGRGAFGLVKKVVTNEGHVLAAKYINVSNILQQKKLRNEVSILQQLRHPNVVQLVDIRLCLSQAVVFMEFIDGKSLAALAGTLTEATARGFIFQICSGLNYLHSRSPPVLHRDIKGENIMVARDGTVKLIDFGSSNFLMPSDASQWFKKAPIYDGYCDLHFLAPELICQGSQFSVKSDVWALGITIYQMMTGRPPFPIDAHLTDNILTHGALPLPGFCSQQLADFYTCCTAMDPSARWPVLWLLNHELFFCD